VSALLAQVRVPTLVMHSRDDARVPFDQGRRLAAAIPGARFVPLGEPQPLDPGRRTGLPPLSGGNEEIPRELADRAPIGDDLSRY
jgi:hypothetical protein